jgi:hypothetical protein
MIFANYVLWLATAKTSNARLKFAFGGYADFRGRDDTLFNIFSVPYLSLAMKTMDAITLMPRPSLVYGSFFTEAHFTTTTFPSRNEIHVSIFSNESGFRAYNIERQIVLNCARKWCDFQQEDVRFFSKSQTVVVIAQGWEFRLTKPRVEYPTRNSPCRRLEMSIVPRKFTPYTRAPHGLLGQSFDSNRLAVDGRQTNFEVAVVNMTEQAEGAIEGTYEDYIVRSPFDTDFKFTRYEPRTDYFPRDVRYGYEATVPRRVELIEDASAEISDQFGKDDFKRLVQ